jgi:hypothetical protein
MRSTTNVYILCFMRLLIQYIEVTAEENDGYGVNHNQSTRDGTKVVGHAETVMFSGQKRHSSWRIGDEFLVNRGDLRSEPYGYRI